MIGCVVVQAPEALLLPAREGYASFTYHGTVPSLKYVKVWLQRARRHDSAVLCAVQWKTQKNIVFRAGATHPRLLWAENHMARHADTASVADCSRFP